MKAGKVCTEKSREQTPHEEISLKSAKNLTESYKGENGKAVRRFNSKQYGGNKARTDLLKGKKRQMKAMGKEGFCTSARSKIQRRQDSGSRWKKVPG